MGCAAHFCTLDTPGSICAEYAGNLSRGDFQLIEIAAFQLSPDIHFREEVTRPPLLVAVVAGSDSQPRIAAFSRSPCLPTFWTIWMS